MELNTEQEMAVQARGGHILVVAAPGSGKTRVIVQRVLDIMAEGSPAASILSVTFTREGAETMSNRAARYLLGQPDGTKIPQTQLDAAKKKYRLVAPFGHHVFCTFHSLGLRFVRANKAVHFAELQDYIVASSSDTGRAMREALRAADLEEKQKKDLQTFISKCKREQRTPTDGAFAQAFEVYGKVLAEIGVLDFDDLLVRMADLLEKNPRVRAAWQVKYLQIDEAQDTDVLQWKIARMMTEKFGNLMAVGDENQGMYSFRGSESHLEENFKARFPDAVVLILPENYRSTSTIVDYCKEIAPAQNDTVLNLRTANPCGVPITFESYGDEESETNDVLRNVVTPGETAILARTNAQLQPFEDGCTEREIPYRILGRGGFWQRYEIETLMAFVRCLVAPDDVALSKVIRSPYQLVRAKRDEKDQVLSWISQQKSQVRNECPLEALRRFPVDAFWNATKFQGLPDKFARWRKEFRGMRPAETVKKLFAEIGAVSYYEEQQRTDGDEPDNSRMENLNRLVAVADKTKSVTHFVEFAARVRHENRSTPNALTLSTIHRAKGLEWNDVFVIGVNDGKLPHAMAEDAMEEARIYFVACSRAAKRLAVSCNAEPSIFIEDKVDANPVTAP
jgi:ATP-dependent DNA helicase UvrD/PcrA